MIQKSHPVGQFNRMVIRQEMGAGTEFDALGAQECLSNEQIRGRVGFPRGGEMFAYPGLVKADAINKLQVLQVPGMALVETSFGGCEGIIKTPAFIGFLLRLPLLRAG